jgi:hypothetical protein
VSETTLRVIFSVLDDPRTDELISDLLRENILQMRTQVHEHAYGDGKGVRVVEPRRGAARPEPLACRLERRAYGRGARADIGCDLAGPGRRGLVQPVEQRDGRLHPAGGESRPAGPVAAPQRLSRPRDTAGSTVAASPSMRPEESDARQP